MCRTTCTCLCPAEFGSDWDDGPDQSQRVLKTPMDYLGFIWKGCWCIPLRVACIFIFFVSVMWALVQMASANKLMGKIFEEDSTSLYAAKIAYSVASFVMIVASGDLLIGILTKNYKMLYLYVLYALFYHCLYVILYMIGLASSLAENGHIDGKISIKLVFTMFWILLFFYFIMIVNSYRIYVWSIQ